MKIFSRLVIALSLSLGVACVAEPFEPEPGDQLATEASELSVVEDGFAEDGVEVNGVFGPMCGEGSYDYFDWVCVRGKGWQEQLVGQEFVSCIYPWDRGGWGKTSRCKVEAMSVCGGGDPETASCNDVVGCPVPKPTSGCPTFPPPPPPPPLTK